MHLGTFTATAAGTVNVTVSIPVTTAAGPHTILISSAGLESIAIPITVVAASSAAVSAAALADTGAQLAPAALLAGLMLLLGTGVLVARRRRTLA